MHTILNLKQPNKHVTYQHFKMEFLSNVFKIIQPNCWMTSVDLKETFYTIPIHNIIHTKSILNLYGIKSSTNILTRQMDILMQ